ncbi:hypothetical protein IEN92_08625 [Polynucleobacter sp. MWH-Creno-3A4]|uniref:hypothetical protein n=1 Tax=Polynucleobacter sp. MWH-Creno-3A4 TaxID=1855886 RepID=UPI001C0D6BAC|nr:hypothetical protein [Polynucleobacter sp. MWH-Creno-3A4]MBU3606809.1 hypothetical protein [Polynucleobacter sp. MWH-Creno-3A4]
MSFDDTAEKVRRNVVVLSAGVIITSVLNLQVDQASKLFGFIELHSISAVKFWALITIVLIYVFLRYWFDGETTKQKSRLLTELSIIRLNVLAKYLEHEIKQAFKKNKVPPSICDFEELRKPELLIRFEEKQSLSDIKLDLSIERNSGSPWSGWVLINYELEWDKKHFSTKSGGNKCQFVISNYTQKLLVAFSYIHLCLYSKSSVDFLIPIFLFLASIGICLSKFVFIFLNC